MGAYGGFDLDKFSAAAGGLGQAIEQRQPISPMRRYIAEMMAGRMSPQEAATRIKIEQQRAQGQQAVVPPPTPAAPPLPVGMMPPGASGPVYQPPPGAAPNPMVPPPAPAPAPAPAPPPPASVPGPPVANPTPVASGLGDTGTGLRLPDQMTNRDYDDLMAARGAGLGSNTMGLSERLLLQQMKDQEAMERLRYVQPQITQRTGMTVAGGIEKGAAGNSSAEKREGMRQGAAMERTRAKITNDMAMLDKKLAAMRDIYNDKKTTKTSESSSKLGIQAKKAQMDAMRANINDLLDSISAVESDPAMDEGSDAAQDIKRKRGELLRLQAEFEKLNADMAPKPQQQGSYDPTRHKFDGKRWWERGPNGEAVPLKSDPRLA